MWFGTRAVRFGSIGRDHVEHLKRDPQRGNGVGKWFGRGAFLFHHHNRRQLPTCYSVLTSPSPKPLSPQARAQQMRYFWFYWRSS